MRKLLTSEDPTASIIILSYERTDLLIDCVSSISRSTDPDDVAFEVILLFQQVSDHDVESVMRNATGARFLRVGLNLGFAGGVNFAASQAKGEYLVFVNDDTEVHPGWLQRLVTAAEGNPRAGAVGSRILFPDGTLQEAGGIIWSDGSTMPVGRGERPGSLAYSYVRSVDYISANGMLIRRSDFERLGGFDRRYFPAYYEDTDLCLALRHHLGREILYAPQSVITHIEAASSTSSDFRQFLFRRNQTQFVQKWANVLETYPLPAPESRRAVDAAISRRRGTPHILVVDDRLPDLGRDAGGLGSGFVRARELFNDLHEYAVSLYVPHRPRQNTLADLGVDVIDESLIEHLSRPGKTYGAVIISRPHNYQAFGETIRTLIPDAPVIYDAEALYHRRVRLQALLASDSERKVTLVSQAHELEELERQIACSADRVVTISPEEHVWLQSIEGHAPIDFMPPLLSGLEITPPTLEARTDAVFVAGWLGGNESPNVDAAVWYCREVLPRVRAALPDFRTIVTGKNPPPAVQALSNQSFVTSGFVTSIAELYADARVAVVPMRIGAGVKNKTIEALQFGVPVVATTVGAEGLDLCDGVDADVTDDPAEFASRIIALYTNDVLWLQRRRMIEVRVKAWQAQRISWRDVVARTVVNGREHARTAS